jgi:hypothetical protein
VAYFCYYDMSVVSLDSSAVYVRYTYNKFFLPTALSQFFVGTQLVVGAYKICIQKDTLKIAAFLGAGPQSKHFGYESEPPFFLTKMFDQGPCSDDVIFNGSVGKTRHIYNWYVPFSEFQNLAVGFRN